MTVDFTKEMKRDYTIIAPDIFPTHMELISEVFRLYGYRLVIAKYEGKEVIDTGLKYLHNDVCYPAICMLGQQIYALTCGDFDPHRCALIQFQTGGGCRASNYICLLRKALEKMDMAYVPVISLSFGGYEKYSGFHITPGMVACAMRSLVYGDMLLLLKNQTLPYEQNAGDTRRTVEKWIARLTDDFRHRRGLTSAGMKKRLRAMAKDFHDIPREKKKLKKVGIVGEIYVKYSSFGNNGLERFLLSQGCEYMVPGVLGFFQYCFANIETDRKYYGGSRAMLLVGRTMERIADRWESALIDGASEWRTFFNINVPQITPTIGALVTTQFLDSWNSYLDPLVFLPDWRLQTLPIALNQFVGEEGTAYNLVSAACCLTVIPVFIVFLCGQKFFVKGLTVGAVKG